MEELLAKLKTRLKFNGVTEDSILTQHLLLAIDVVNDKRKYTATDTDVVEKQYKNIVVEMAVSSYAKMGAEGELAHNENGTNRTYESGLYPRSLMQLIIPVATFTYSNPVIEEVVE